MNIHFMTIFQDAIQEAPQGGCPITQSRIFFSFSRIHADFFSFSRNKGNLLKYETIYAIYTLKRWNYIKKSQLK